MPSDELEAGSRLLFALLTCDFDAVYDEVMLHKFHMLPTDHFFKPYEKCRQRNHAGGRAYSCTKHLPRRCLARFGRNATDMAYCKRMLAAGRGASASGEPPSAPFTAFVACYAAQRARSRGCREAAVAACRATGARAVKTVRAPMAMAERLLRLLPSLQLVHVLRDPRAVYLSRRNYCSLRHIDSKDARSAVFYCDDVARDLRLRTRLEARYPGQIRQLFYEEFVVDPLRTARQLYDFIRHPIHDAVTAYATANRRNTSLAKWRVGLLAGNVAIIDQQCCELYRVSNASWPVSRRYCQVPT